MDQVNTEPKIGLFYIVSQRLSQLGKIWNVQGHRLMTVSAVSRKMALHLKGDFRLKYGLKTI